MELQEIKDKIKTSNPGEIIDLVKAFDTYLSEREEIPAFNNFIGEYFGDLKELRFTRDPENAKRLEELLDIAIDVEKQG